MAGRAMIQQRRRRFAFTGLLAVTAALLMGVVWLSQLASASSPPVEMTMACAHNNSGVMRYVTSASACTGNEHLVAFDIDSPVTLCIPSNNAVARLVADPADCGNPNHVVTAPTLAGPVYLCKQNVTGMIKGSAGAGQCNGNHSSIFIAQGEEPNEPPLAVDDSYDGVIGNVPRSVAEPADACVLANDSDPDGDTLVAVAGTSATTLGGTVDMQADGCFTYNPPTGVTNAVDIFTYTTVDPDGLEASAEVSMAIGADIVWFVDEAFAGTSDGRFTNPFTTLAPLNGPGESDEAGAYIFVYSGTYDGGLALEDDQALVGEPHGLTIGGQEIVVAGGTAPTIQHASGTALAVAGNNTVHAINLNGETGLSGASFETLVVSGTSIMATGGAGVALSDGVLDVTLASLSASGGLNGLTLVGTSGTFVVTGDGENAGSGGTIANTTLDVNVLDGIGIYLEDAAGVSLAFMQINDHPRFAVRGINVTGFELIDSVIDGENGSLAFFFEGSMWFDDLHGSAAIVDSVISGGVHDNLRIVNTTGALDLTVSGSSISDNSDADGGAGFLLTTLGDANVSLTVADNAFEAHRTDHLRVRAAGGGETTVALTGNTFNGGHAASFGQGVFLLTTETFSGTLAYDIQDNSISDTVSGGALHVNKGLSPSGTVRGTIANNTVGDPNVPGSGCLDFCSGIRIEAHGGGSHAAHILNNEVYQYEFSGIDLVAGEGTGSAALDVTIQGNTLSSSSANVFAGIYLNAGTTGSDVNAVCADVGGAGALANMLDGSLGMFGLADVYLEQRFGTTVRLPGYLGGSTDSAAVEAFIASQNNGTLTIFAIPSGLGGGFVGGLSCASP